MFDFKAGVFQNATLEIVSDTSVRVAENTIFILFYFKLENEIRQKFGALEERKGTDCKQRPLLATGRELQCPDAWLPLGSGPS